MGHRAVARAGVPAGGADRDGAASWPGGFLVGLDRVRADQAGRLVRAGLAASTATGIVRRFTAAHWRGAEAGLAPRPRG